MLPTKRPNRGLSFELLTDKGGHPIQKGRVSYQLLQPQTALGATRDLIEEIDVTSKEVTVSLRRIVLLIDSKNGIPQDAISSSKTGDPTRTRTWDPMVKSR